jgi:hypothetical protein
MLAAFTIGTLSHRVRRNVLLSIGVTVALIGAAAQRHSQESGDHRVVELVVRDAPELSDAAWAVTAPLPPVVGRARGRWRDHRSGGQ